MADIVIHTDEDGDKIIVTADEKIVVKAPLPGCWVTKDEAPQVAAELASAITGEEMVVVRRGDVQNAVDFLASTMRHHLSVIRLGAALGPEPCPARIHYWVADDVNDLAATCTLPKGHDGDHIPPATVWTVPS